MGALFSWLSEPDSKRSKQQVDEIRNKYANAIKEGNASLIRGANEYIEQVHPDLPPHIKARILEGFNTSNAPILNRIANWFGIEGEIHKKRLRYILQHKEYKNYISKSPTLKAQQKEYEQQALNAIPPHVLNPIVDGAITAAVKVVDPHLQSVYMPKSPTNESFFGSLFNTPILGPVAHVVQSAKANAVHSNQQQHLTKINQQLQELGRQEEQLRRQQEANAMIIRTKEHFPKNAPLKQGEQVVQVEQVTQPPAVPGAFNTAVRNNIIRRHSAEIYNKMREEFNIELNKTGIMQIYIDFLKKYMKIVRLYEGVRKEWIENYEVNLNEIIETIKNLETDKINLPTSHTNKPLNEKITEKYNTTLSEVRNAVMVAGRNLLRIYNDVIRKKPNNITNNEQSFVWNEIMSLYEYLELDIGCAILKTSNDCSPEEQLYMYDASQDRTIELRQGRIILPPSPPSLPPPSLPPTYDPKRYPLPNYATKIATLATAPAFYPAPPLNKSQKRGPNSLSNFFDPAIVATMNKPTTSKPREVQIEQLGEVYSGKYTPLPITPIEAYHSTNDLPIYNTSTEPFPIARPTTNFERIMNNARRNTAKKEANKAAAKQAAINLVKKKQGNVFRELQNRQAAITKAAANKAAANKAEANRIAKERANTNMLFNIGDDLQETMALQEQKNKNVTNRVRDIYIEENPNEIFVMNGNEWNQPESLGRFNVKTNTCNDLLQKIKEKYSIPSDQIKIRMDEYPDYIELSRLCEKSRIKFLSDIIKQPVSNIYISFYPKIKVQFMMNSAIKNIQEVFITKKISELATTGKSIIINGKERPITDTTRLSDMLTIAEQKMYENSILQIVLPSSGGKRRYTRRNRRTRKR